MASTPAVHTGRWDHVFFSTMSVALGAVVAVGFLRTYSARIAAGTVSPLAHLHGAVFALWMILLSRRRSSWRKEERAGTAALG